MKTTPSITICGKPLIHLLVAAIALGAATAHAEWWGFKGSSSSPSYWDVQGNWHISGNTWSNFETSTCDNFHLNPRPSGSNIFVAGWDSNITFKAASKLSGRLNFCAGTTADPITFIAENGDAAYGIESSKDLYVKSDSNSPDACLEILSGTYVFNIVKIATVSGMPGTIKVNGGTLSAKTYFEVGAGGNGCLEIGNGGLVNHTNDKYLNIGNSGNGTVTIKAGGAYENISGNGNTIMANSATTGTLDIQGGTFTIKGSLSLNYNVNAIQSVVKVTEGGVLTAKQITLSNAGTNGGTLTLNGGTLRAYASNASFLPAHASLHVYVGANGGVIDTDGFNVTIGEDIENVSGEDGVVRFTGDGVATFTGMASHTGGTIVDAGTKLVLTAAAKNALFANGVSVAIPAGGAADGAVVFEITGGGTFTQSDIDDHTAISGDSVGRYALMLADNGTKIAVTDTLAGEYVWNGGSSGASWKTAGYWTKNGVAGNWYDSTAAVFANAGDAVTVDNNVTAASIAFRANTTITGSATLSAGEVAVSNGVAASISGPTSGAMEKTGPGTLTLSSSRLDQTTLTDGTLILTGSDVVLDGSRLTLGNVAGSSIALRLENGASLGSAGALGLGSADGGSASLYSTGDWSASGDMVLGSGANASGEYIHADGTLTIGGHIYIGNNAASDSARAYLEVSGGAIEFSARRHIFVGNRGAAGFQAEMVVKNDARVSPGMSIVVGNTTGGTLMLTNDAYVVTGTYDAGGHITLSSESSQNGDPCFLNLFGGVLETVYVAHGSGSGLATVNFDGGTLKAQTPGTLISAHNKLEVVVGPKGGTIDSAGVAVTIAEPLTGTGGMTFAGGGGVTLNSVPAYSGKTTVELGTTLVVPAAMAGENLEIAIPEELESGLYKVVAISGNGTFTDDVLTAVTLPAGGRLRLFLNAAKTEIWGTYAFLGDHVWIGGSNGSLNVDGNWFPSGVPSGDNAVILNETAASLTNPEGSAFAPKSIKFHADTAPVTISGATISGVSTILNYSENQVEFENAVTFAEDIDVVQNPGVVKFSGGATGVGLARATDIHGAYNLTGFENRVEHGGTTVKSDGVYNLPNATFHKHNGDFHIDAGGRARVNSARIATKSGGAYLLGTNNGEFKVDGEFVVEGNGGTPTHYTANGTGTFIVNTIRVIQGGNIVPMGAVGSKTVIGAGGIVRGEGYVRVSNNGSHWIGSCADWTMYYKELGANTAVDKFVVYKHNSSTTWSTVTFDTTDFYDDTIGRTITCESLIGAANPASAEKFKVNVTGIGKLVFANTVDNDNIFSGGLMVTNSATVSVMPGARPGKGYVTLEDTSTLQVAASGTVTLGGNLTVADGAALAFNFTDKTTPPVLAMADGKTVTLGSQSNVIVKISSKGDLRPKGGTYTLTSGGKFADATALLASDSPRWVKGVKVVDGEIVLETRGTGTALYIR